MTFATTFYASLLRGQRFLDAVAEARAATYAEGGNTWAAYQCYGDADWVFRRDVSDPQQHVAPVGDEFAGVASPTTLAMALESLAIKSRYQKAPAEHNVRRSATGMQASYARAEARARQSRHPKLFYPALNRMAAELVLNVGKPNWAKFDPAAVADAHNSLANKVRDDPDFWSIAGFAELRMYEAIANQRLAAELPAIEDEFDSLHTRVNAPYMWSLHRRSGGVRATEVRHTHGWCRTPRVRSATGEAAPLRTRRNSIAR